VVGGADAGTTTYNYNTINQLTDYELGARTVTLTYDLNGNRTSRVVTGGSDNGSDVYTYDFENRLVGLIKGTGGTAGGAGMYAYTYDYRTRRIVRDESGAGGATTSIVFSGGTSVQEYDNGNTTPTVEYIRGSDYGGGVGGILYTLRTVNGNLTPSYTHENKRGDVVAKTSPPDANGNVSLTFQAQYEAFGKQTQTTGRTLDRQKSNSKDTDPTGLVDEGFRYRDLETGMFINRDPAGFVDGPNLYTYVVQNPWTKFDPEGLDAVTIVGGPVAKPEPKHDNANDNYLKAGVRNAITDQQKLTKSGSKEKVHLIIYGKGYDTRAKNDGDASDNNLAAYVNAATKAGVDVKVVNSASDILKEAANIAAGETGVSKLSYYGHSNARNLLINYGENEVGSASELINTGDLTKAIPSNRVTSNFSAALGGCHLGNTAQDNIRYGQGQNNTTSTWGGLFSTPGNGPAMAEGMSNYYKNAPIMGSSGKTDYTRLGQGWGNKSPSSEGGYNYWQNGAVTSHGNPGEMPH
jgi:RHS repeat-associated protein